jgi:NAD(P)-dependent dehydrogenase (short-subunit alcohol dehydrogenase family)
VKNNTEMTAIITGSSRGLGKQTAIELAKHGASVVINYNSNEEEALATVNGIISKGGKAIAVKADVSKSEDVDYLFEKTIEHFGKIDIVVNNA